MAEKVKVTIMVLKVDLQCHKCYKKVKKVLCKFPQIRDQIYDEKQNQVVIKVVCCGPEKIRDKICCKGGGAIKSIDIKEPEKPKPKEDPSKPPPDTHKEMPKEDPLKPTPPCSTEKPKEDPPNTPPPTKKPTPVPVPPCPPPYPVNACCMDCYHGRSGGPCQSCYGGLINKPTPVPVPLCPPRAPPYPVNVCCMDCYHGRPGGPCQSGYGGPAPFIQCDGYYGRPVYDSYGPYGGGRGYNCVTRWDCFSEENPSACTVV